MNNQPVRSPYLQPPLLFNSHTSNRYFLCLKSGTRKLETTPVAHNLTKLFRLFNPKLVQICPPCFPFPGKAQGCTFPFAPLPPEKTLVFSHVPLCGVACPLVLGNVSNTLFFQRQLFLCLSPHHSRLKYFTPSFSP